MRGGSEDRRPGLAQKIFNAEVAEETGETQRKFLRAFARNSLSSVLSVVFVHSVMNLFGVGRDSI
jgi:hypothetical protein